MRVAFGLDLAGYYGGKSGLAKASFDDIEGYSIVIYRQHAFAVRREGRHPLQPHIDSERHLLRVLKPLYVDVPIDLQHLPRPKEAFCIWQLVKRPVDFAFGAIPPLADKLGSPVARMLNLLEDDLTPLEKTLFETYPRASLLPLLGFVPKYKRQNAAMQDGKWIGDGDLAVALSKMNAKADEGTQINDDGFDAAICALTGVLGDEWLLQGKELEREIRGRLEHKMSAADLARIKVVAPQGYVLIGKPLSQLPLHVRVEQELVI